jgi:ATP-dependent DNA helicase MPH1
LKQLREAKEYKEFDTYLQESLATKNHPKLKKLVEILFNFFNDPEHTTASKVIVFSQFRDSAKEIKAYLDRKAGALVKSEIFVGQNNNGLT